MALQDSFTLLPLARKLLHTSGPLAIPTLSPAHRQQKGRLDSRFTVTQKSSWFPSFPTDPNAAASTFISTISSSMLSWDSSSSEGSLTAQNHLITTCEADSPTPRVQLYFLTKSATCARLTLVPELPEPRTEAGKPWGEHSIVRTAIILSSMQEQVLRFQPGD